MERSTVERACIKQLTVVAPRTAIFVKMLHHMSPHAPFLFVLSEWLPACLASVPSLSCGPEGIVQLADHSDEPYIQQCPWEIGTIEMASILTKEDVNSMHDLGEKEKKDPEPHMLPPFLTTSCPSSQYH